MRSLAKITENGNFLYILEKTINFYEYYFKHICSGGGIGRRAWFRSMCSQERAGSTPVPSTLMKFFVYVLKNKIDSTRYIGQTHNLHIRLKQHNDCKVKSTKSKSPWFIAYYEKYSTRQDAINRELYLKSGIGREWLDNKLSS